MRHILCGLVFFTLVSVFFLVRWLLKPRAGVIPMYKLDDGETWLVVDGYGTHTHSTSISLDDWNSETEKFWWDE